MIISMRTLRRKLPFVLFSCLLMSGIWWLSSPRKEYHPQDAQTKPQANNVNPILPPSLEQRTVSGAEKILQDLIVGGFHGKWSKDPHPLDDMNVEDGLGAPGRPVEISASEEEAVNNIIEETAFNELASNRISLHRTVPDTRYYKCKNLNYPDQLPKASVIIIFTEESWSALIRTVWSVLDTSEDHPEHLKEIILVDDFSQKPSLGRKLEEYIQERFPPIVKLVRLKKREGLIRARLTGARLATGEVMVFLDSHCECGYNWLVPLLSRIKEDPKAFVVPIIDVIDQKTMEYYNNTGTYFQIGGFSWEGQFTWIEIPDHELQRRQKDTDPVKTPTMAGGLFAVDRKTFWDFGSYDEEMDLWGGENLEMSFRVWQCGGSVETIPCSRVGHIFRDFHPYTFPGNKDTHGINTARAAEVWMDDYKKIFYIHRPDLLLTDVGDLSARKKFRQKKQCKSFDWYLKEIYPEKFIPTSPRHVSKFGRVRNLGLNDRMCFDTLSKEDNAVYKLGVFPCNDVLSTSQFFSYSKENRLRHEESCATVDENNLADGNLKVFMKRCDDRQEQMWKVSKKGRILHMLTKRCLDVTMSSNPELLVKHCSRTNTQLWNFENDLS